MLTFSCVENVICQMEFPTVQEKKMQSHQLYSSRGHCMSLWLTFQPLQIAHEQEAGRMQTTPERLPRKFGGAIRRDQNSSQGDWGGVGVRWAKNTRALESATFCGVDGSCISCGWLFFLTDNPPRRENCLQMTLLLVRISIWRLWAWVTS